MVALLNIGAFIREILWEDQKLTIKAAYKYAENNNAPAKDYFDC